MLAQLLGKPRNQKLAVVLALAGALLPFSGWHKFYVGQPGWGVTYLLLFFTPIPQIASGIEALWYLAQEQEAFDERFNGGAIASGKGPLKTTVPVAAEQISAIASAMRELDNLRQEGLLSEYEFEQKRRQLLDNMG